MADNTQNQESPVDRSQDIHLKTNELIGLAIGIIALTFLIVWAFYYAYNKLEGYNVDIEVEWPNSNDILLENSPHWFLHDSATIKTLKQIDAQDKLLLLSLLEKDSLIYPAYSKAIDKLTFISNKASRIPFSLILIIGGISAVIGVQIRTMFDFVGRACYKKNIELKVWWPWYVVRPFLGFLVGGVVIVFIEASILKSAINYNVSNLFLVGVTVLAGFGVTDVVDLLRKLSKKIFGTENYQNK